MKEIGHGGLQEAVEDACKRFRLTYYHTWRSLHSPAGFPDMVIQIDRPKPCMIVAELKAEKRRPSDAQVQWLDFFGRLSDLAPQMIEVYLWRPSHWLSGAIAGRLAGHLASPDVLGAWRAGAGVPGDRFSSAPMPRRGKL